MSSVSPDVDYLGLRDLALSPWSFASAGEADRDELVGAMMEMNMGSAIATLVAFNSGDASLYYSSGGGMLGGVGIPAVRAAALRMVAAYAEFSPTLAAGPAPELPGEGLTQYIVIDAAGLRSAVDVTPTSAQSASPFLSLFSAGQDVITAFRESRETLPSTPKRSGLRRWLSFLR